MLLSLLLVLSPSEALRPSHVESCTPSSELEPRPKESFKYIVWIDVSLMESCEVLPVAGLASGFRAMNVEVFGSQLIVPSLLLRVGESGIGCRNLLEGLLCARSFVSIGMELDGEFLVCLADLALGKRTTQPKDFVEVVFRDDVSG